MQKPTSYRCGPVLADPRALHVVLWAASRWKPNSGRKQPLCVSRCLYCCNCFTIAMVAFPLLRASRSIVARPRSHRVPAWSVLLRRQEKSVATGQPCPRSPREMGFEQDRRGAPRGSPYQASQAIALLCKRSWPCLSQASVARRCPGSNGFMWCAISKIGVSLSHHPGLVSAGAVVLVAQAGGHVSALLGSSCRFLRGVSRHRAKPCGTSLPERREQAPSLAWAVN